MMRFLADEGCDSAIITALRTAGHDVIAVAQVAPSLADAEILAWGVREQCIILHHDMDFGDLIVRDGLESYGVVLVRIEDGARDLKAQRVLDTIAEYGDALAGAITRVNERSSKRTALNAVTRKPAQTAPLAPPRSDPDLPDSFSVPDYDGWQTFAQTLDGEAICRQRGIRRSWYAEQVRRYQHTGTWEGLSLLELRLILYFEWKKRAYSAGSEPRERIENLLSVIAAMI
jgi:predicted nuclease of predicted toxin-antitoxin system